MAKKIMIVDDDPNIVSYLTDLFTDNGYRTCTAADGTDALTVVQEEQPDLITLDLEMPREWGPRFYRKLTQNDEFKKIPVIVISGLEGNKYAIQKAVASLTKPFDRDELLSIVKDVLGE
ncbi:DVU0259 family response regulator domain-containing protein [Pseudodesulfovibrio tunisiensis]|uniref:DVU0259 family response regulator domain-containing protein n=1 Tax=Pseudodesulfovibrio tunisiensis TaxID=463192 RepID=UPI001FB47EDC|nr:response regulator [Pseudodesulfovibrio tunisiensis]